MKVGIPREVKNHEYRVAITPAGVHELVRARPRGLRRDGRRRRLVDHRRRVRRGRRRRSSPRADDVWAHRRPDPQGQGADRRGVPPDARGPDALHLPAPGRVDRPCTDALLDRKVTGIAYETVELPDRSLPLLAPMSEVAGRLAPQVGAHTLMRAEGGRGVLMGGVSGVYAAKVVVIGAGVSGHERRRDRARHAGRGAAARPQHRRGCGRSTRSTRATCRRSRRTPTRSSGRCSTPTWSSARCWCRAPRRRRWSPTSWSRG